MTQEYYLEQITTMHRVHTICMALTILFAILTFLFLGRRHSGRSRRKIPMLAVTVLAASAALISTGTAEAIAAEALQQEAEAGTDPAGGGNSRTLKMDLSVKSDTLISGTDWYADEAEVTISVENDGVTDKEAAACGYILKIERNTGEEVQTIRLDLSGKEEVEKQILSEGISWLEIEDLKIEDLKTETGTDAEIKKETIEKEEQETEAEINKETIEKEEQETEAGEKEKTEGETEEGTGEPVQEENGKQTEEENGTEAEENNDADSEETVLKEKTQAVLIFSEDGIYSFTIEADFEAEAQEEIRIEQEDLTIRIDRSAPRGDMYVTDLSGSKISAESDNTFGQVFYASGVRIEMQTVDLMSGVRNNAWYISPVSIDMEDLDETDPVLWSDYTEPVSLTGEGIFYLYGRVTDRVGHTAYCSSGRICIDRTAPSVSVTITPEQPAAGNMIYSGTDHPSFVISASEKGNTGDSGITTVSWQMKNEKTGEIKEGTLTQDQNDTDPGWSASVAVDPDFCENGTVIFSAEAADRAGNREVSGSESLVIDGMNPKADLLCNTVKSGSGKEFSTEAEMTVSVIEDNFDPDSLPKIESSVKGGYSFSGWEIQDGKAEGVIRFQKDGDYSVSFSCTDLAGNRSGSAVSQKISVDRTDPEITITGVENLGAYAGAVDPRVRISDLNFDLSSVKCFLHGAHSGNLEVHTLSDITRTEDGIEIDLNALSDEEDDVYTLSVETSDYAGNESEAQMIFSTDRYGSSYVMSDSLQALIDQYYISEPIDLVLSEINSSPVEYSVTLTRDSEIVPLEEEKDYSVEVRGGEGEWMIYTYRISAENFQEEGVYHLDLTSKDRADNVNNNQIRDARIDFAVDHTPPLIAVSNLEDGVRYREKSHSFTVSAADRISLKNLKVEVNGTVLFEQEGTPEDKIVLQLDEKSTEQKVLVTAEDAAGNTAVSQEYCVLVQTDEKVLPDWEEEQRERIQKEKKSDAGSSEEYEKRSSHSRWFALFIPVGVFGVLTVIVLIRHRKQNRT